MPVVVNGIVQLSLKQNAAQLPAAFHQAIIKHCSVRHAEGDADAGVGKGGSFSEQRDLRHGVTEQAIRVLLPKERTDQTIGFLRHQPRAGLGPRKDRLVDETNVCSMVIPQAAPSGPAPMTAAFT